MAVTSRSAVKWVQSREDHYEISLSLSHTHSNVITTNPLKLKATNHKKLDVYVMSVFHIFSAALETCLHSDDTTGPL